MLNLYRQTSWEVRIYRIPNLVYIFNDRSLQTENNSERRICSVEQFVGKFIKFENTT